LPLNAPDANCACALPRGCIDMAPLQDLEKPEREGGEARAKAMKERMASESRDPRTSRPAARHCRVLKRKTSQMNLHSGREIFERSRGQTDNRNRARLPPRLRTAVVSVVLSAQATDKSVNLAPPKLFPVADPTPRRW